MGDAGGRSGLRVVTFNVLPMAYQLVARWAEQGGHRLVLLVTTPGPSTRRMPVYRETVSLAPPGQDVLVTTRLRRVAAPLIRELEPDLIVSFTFPYRIPPEITSIPRHGAVNLHPTPLPAYRGPNVARPIYEGWPEIGATLHRTEEEYDTGAILAQYTAPLPEPVTPAAVMAVWPPLMARAFAEGIEAALRGDEGTPQDHSRASYAAPFTEAEHWLDWAEAGVVLQRRVAALNLFGSPEARARIEGEAHRIARLEPLAGARPSAEAGAVLERIGKELVLAVADGAVRIAIESIAAGNEG